MQGFKLIIEVDKDEPEAAEVLVDGHADQVGYRFLLDTGCITCVDFGVIKANPNAFTSLGELGIEDTAENGNVDMPLYLMKGLSHAGHQFPQHRVVGVDLSPINEKIEKRMDIVLGYNSLAKANWLFDFPNRTCTITKMLQ